MDQAALTSVLLASVVVSTFVSGLFGVVTFLLHRREQRRTRAFEVRFLEYKSYLQALDDMTSSWAERAAHLVQEGQAHFDSIIKGTGSPTDHVAALNKALGTMTADMIVTLAGSKRQLSGLRLVGTDKLLALVDEYVALHDQMPGRLGTAIEALRTQSPTAQSLGDVADTGQRVESLRKRIVAQMRKELRVD